MSMYFFEAGLFEIKERVWMEAKVGYRDNHGKIVEWFGVYFSGGNVAECMEKQIREFVCSVLQ